MKRHFKLTLMTLFTVMAATVGCSDLNTQDALLLSGSSEALTAEAQTAVTAKYSSLYYRGTSNTWGKTAMTYNNDSTWSIELTLPAGAIEFKFDVKGDWSQNFGDNGNDLVLDASGANIKYTCAGENTYRIIFHEGVNGAKDKYSVNAKAIGTNVVVFNTYQVMYKNCSVYAGTTLIDSSLNITQWSRHDPRRGGFLAPTAFLPSYVMWQNTPYRAVFDSVVDGVRLVGEVTFTLGASGNETFSMTVSEYNEDPNGTVNFTVLYDTWVNGALVAQPSPNTPLYDGDYHYNQLIGGTDYAGKVTATLSAGAHDISVAFMPNSHSFYSKVFPIVVEQGKTIEKELRIVTTKGYVEAYNNVGSGNALYITGASSYLGNWSKAYKMTWDGAKGAWTFNAYMPYYLPFKIVKAAWTDASEISTANVIWEKGENRTLYSDTWVDYNGRLIKAYPSF